MDLANVGRQARNDTEARAIRSVMVQKREALRCIEREMAQLAENKRGIEEDLDRLGVALTPYICSLLPNEVLSHIFILLAQDHGPAEFPIQEDNTPPQLTISQVSSRWRRVALGTPELWSDTYLIYPRKTPRHIIRLHQQWLSRARAFPVTLSIWFNRFSDSSDELASALQSILFATQVKRLSLRLAYTQFIALSTLLAIHLSAFELDVIFPFINADLSMNDPHPLVNRLQSVTFRFDERSIEALNWIDSLRPWLPWSQLRSLNFNITVMDLHLIFSILRQTPMLETLTLSMVGSGVLEPLIMPLLRTLVMNIDTSMPDDCTQILRSFTCPSLTKFSLITYGTWTDGIVEILKQQYNMQQLREFKLDGNYALRLSSFLRSGPMLSSLSLRLAEMDDEAIIGISNGSLGRFLKRLLIDTDYDVGDLLGMVEARKKTVDELIKNGCTWREKITVLRDVVIHSKDHKGYKERITALKESGIAITFLNPRW